jgi:hypothetical protein
MMTFDDILRFSLTVSPQSIPRFWTFVNVILLFYSTVLLVILAFRGEGDVTYDLLASEWYLTYDVVICLVWLIETSLTMAQTWLVVIKPLSLSSLDSTTTTGAVSSTPITAASSRSTSSICSKWHIIEWILALYFLMDSIVRVVKKVHGNDHTADMVFDVSINCMAYGYVVVAQYLERRQYEQQQRRLLDGYEDTHDVEIHSHSADHHERTLPPSYMV